MANARVNAPMQATVLDVTVAAGDAVHAETVVVVLEAMKMEHNVRAGTTGYVLDIAVEVGATVLEGDALLAIEEADVDVASTSATTTTDLDAIRPDLAEVLARQRGTGDDARPEAVERRRRTGQRTARENVADLCDADSFVEYGSLVIAAQRARRSVEELIARTPADGLVGGIGRVDGDATAVVSYDYTVLAGTQGQQNHRKKDRLF